MEEKINCDLKKVNGYLFSAPHKKNFLAKESELFIFSDGSKNESDSVKVREVRNYLKTISGFKSLNIIIGPLLDPYH